MPSWLPSPTTERWGGNPLHPTGQPGTRLAHVPLLRDGHPVSTLDLIGRDFMLLVGQEASGWVQPARAAAARYDIPLTIYQFGIDVFDRESMLPPRTGLGPAGALLVRPDGFIAWRSCDGAADPRSRIDHVFARVLCREFQERDQAA